MKLKDIQINGEYACGSPREKTNLLRSRVRVLSIGIYEKPGFYSRTKRRRAKVLLLSKEGDMLYDGDGRPHVKVVEGQELLRSWQEEEDRYREYCRIQNEISEKKRKLKGSLDEVYRDAFEICKEAGCASEWTSDFGKVYYRFHLKDGIRVDSYGEHSVGMNITAFRDLVEALVIAGVDVKEVLGRDD